MASRAPRAKAPRARPERPSVDEAELARAKRASVAQLLFRAARRLNGLTLARVRALTGVDIRPAHTALFPHIDLAGTRQSVLAERLGVSKQAVNKLVAELVDEGALELSPDPSDARATLVRFSARKGRTLLDGLALLATVERELEASLGEGRYRELHRTLLDIERWLDEQEANGG